MWTLWRFKNFLLLEYASLYGKMNNEHEKKQRERVVLEMIDGLSSDYDITADNFLHLLLLQMIY